MPIRFRCVYCNQLLGIAKRKAGTIVRCTNCDGQLIVPDLPDNEPDELAPGTGTAEASGVGTGQQAPLFERNDFADLLHGFRESSPSVVAAADPVATAHSPLPRPVVALPEPQPASASSPAEVAAVLTRRRLTVLCMSVALLIGLAFAVGLWVGMTMQSH